MKTWLRIGIVVLSVLVSPAAFAQDKGAHPAPPPPPPTPSTPRRLRRRLRRHRPSTRRRLLRPRTSRLRRRCVRPRRSSAPCRARARCREGRCGIHRCQIRWPLPPGPAAAARVVRRRRDRRDRHPARGQRLEPVQPPARRGRQRLAMTAGERRNARFRTGSARAETGRRTALPWRGRIRPTTPAAEAVTTRRTRGTCPGIRTASGCSTGIRSGGARRTRPTAMTPATPTAQTTATTAAAEARAPTTALARSR